MLQLKISLNIFAGFVCGLFSVIYFKCFLKHFATKNSKRKLCFIQLVREAAADLSQTEWHYLKLNVTQYFWCRAQYNNDLFEADQRVIKASDMIIFNAAAQFIQKLNDGTAKIERSGYHFNWLPQIVEPVVTAFKAFVENIEITNTRNAEQVDNPINRIIFSYRLQSLAKLKAVN